MKKKKLQKLALKKDVISSLQAKHIVGGRVGIVGGASGVMECPAYTEGSLCTIATSFGGGECIWSQGVDDYIQNETDPMSEFC